MVFQKLSPHETFFLAPTSKVDVSVIDNNPNIQFTIKDYPGTYELKDSVPQDVAAIKACGSLIYVIDGQQDNEQTCLRLREVIKTCSAINKNISYEVFIHKIDSDLFQTEDNKMDCFNEVQD